jgi:hypothetical protein
MPRRLEIIVCIGVIATATFGLVEPVLFGKVFEPRRLFCLPLLAIGILGFWRVWLQPMDPAVEEARGAAETTRRGEALLVLAGFLSVLPWSVVWMAVLVPLSGLEALSVPAHAAVVFGVPALAPWLWSEIRAARGRKSHGEAQQRLAQFRASLDKTEQGRVWSKRLFPANARQRAKDNADVHDH